ncbi:hypothetical protein C8R47DRAFT_596630 [Mycena vitilis]|nr:hypothetical protein C8R47DRAFT_596630 [Mycena vitilis]
MHESLRLNKISGLSVHERAMVTAAMKGSLRRLRNLVELVNVFHDEIRFLPVFYHHLDPSKIPSDAMMDAEILSDDILSAVTLASFSLEGLFDVPTPPPGSHHDLWLRVWPWAQFFDVHHSRFADLPTEDILRARFFSAIGSFTKPYTETSRQITSTPGMGILAAQAWGSYFRDPNRTAEVALRRLADFLVVVMSSAYDFNEFVEGAGGEDALAVLVVRLAEYLLASTLNPTRATALNLAGLVDFSTRIENHTWMSGLLSRKYLSALLSIMMFADRVSDGATAANLALYQDLYKNTWNMFWSLLLHKSGYTQIVEAIDAGVLTLVVSVASKHIPWTATGLRLLITSVLRPATLYHPVLSALEPCLRGLEEPTSKSAFLSSVLHQNWLEFVEVAIDRFDVKRRFDSRQHATQKACDNMECGKIFDKAVLKRCAGCEYQHYCSKQCQVMDWTTGHRAMCRWTRRPDAWRADHLDGPVFFTGRDRAFLRAIVAYDYERHQEHIFLIRILQLRQSGECSASVFDYTEGQVKITEEPVTNGGEVFSRVAKSGRRMHVNAVTVAKDIGYWQLPTRSSSSHIHDALFALAERIPPGTVKEVSDLPPEVVQVVKKLIEAATSSNYLEIV